MELKGEEKGGKEQEIVGVYRVVPVCVMAWRSGCVVYYSELLRLCCYTYRVNM